MCVCACVCVCACEEGIVRVCVGAEGIVQLTVVLSLLQTEKLEGDLPITTNAHAIFHP